MNSILYGDMISLLAMRSFHLKIWLCYRLMLIFQCPSAHSRTSHELEGIRDELDGQADQMEPSESEPEIDYEQKYNMAMRLLGEKDVELEILRELLKKTNPAYPKK